MIKEIQYTGYATEPSDYECADGQLATSLNLISEDNQLKPVFQPLPVLELPDGDEVVFVHKTSAFTHYIIKRTSTASNVLLWLDEQYVQNTTEYKSRRKIPRATIASNYRMVTSNLKEVLRISAVGNTLVILSDTGIHYVLWRSKDDSYLYLGQQPPDVKLRFTTSSIYPDSYDRGTIETTDTSKTYYAAWRMMSFDASACCTINSAKTAVTFKEDKQDEITQSIWALINQTNAQITRSGHFYAPFFVRYCYRLYDGSMFMHSAPIFIPVSMPETYHIEIPNIFSNVSNNNIDRIVNSMNVIEEQGSGKDFKLTKLGFRYRPINVALRYRCDGNYSTLQTYWSDIVKSIDIFVSLPLVRENGATDDKGNFDEKIKTASRAPKSYYLESGILAGKSYTWQLNGDSNLINDVICDIPMLSEDAYLDKIKNVGNFYKVHSFNLNDRVRASWTEVPLNKSVLPVLATQEVMVDDYKSHNTLLPSYDKKGNCISYLYNYNSRLNISGVREKLFSGFDALGLLPSAYDITVGNIYINHIIVYLNTEEGEKIVIYRENGSTQVSGRLVETSPLFYPDNRAVKMIVNYQKSGESTQRNAELLMDACPLLNGAFTHGGILSSDTYSLSEPSKTIPSVAELLAQTPTAAIENKIYTSEVNNPFYFPVTGINTVGTGTIFGICSAVKALSQGQFGQFPLYAFTTDGVWALEVASNGTYSARQPITRDVCINADSITQLDDAVLFATDRGIMLIQGSQTTCITDNIFSEAPFDVTTLPHIDQLHAKMGDKHATDACLPVKPFLGFLAGCQMIYDYVHQRIIVFNPLIKDGEQQYTYAYVYSLKSKQWGMMYSNLQSGINSYPDALAMTHDNTLVSFSDTDEETCKGLYITRPLKLEAADVHKTISALIQRGHFQRGDVGTVLYGSRDLYTWRLIWSSRDHYLRGFRGTPYKYFRIAGIATLTDGKSIFGASVNFEPRHTNQLR